MIESCACDACQAPWKPERKLLDLPLADEVCVVCGFDNDSMTGEMCTRCVRDQEESM